MPDRSWLVRFAIAFASFTGTAAAQSPPPSRSASAAPPRAESARIQRDIERLASDGWEGRATCSAGLDSAATFIAARFAALRLQPRGTSAATTGAPGASSNGARGNQAFYHRYTARPMAQYGAPSGGCPSQNVVGVLPGSDPRLAGEYVIVGAHYDHLGRSTVGALDPQSADSIRNGADDNASGTAGVLELARVFSAQPTRRSILFVTFSGEEWGLLGSEQFAATALPSGRIQAMVNFDMIGRLKNERLIVYGVGTATELDSLVRAHNAAAGLNLGLNPDGYGPSDQTSFYARNIPVLHFFTDTHEDYHRASDEASRINAAGQARVLDYAAAVIRDIANREAPLTLNVQARPQPRAAGGGARPYLGSIPDMAASDTPGLRVTGVTPGSPADQAGMKGGDIVVELGGTRITDLQSYSDALGTHKPGDVVTVVVLRGAARVALKVTLGTRGG